MQSLGLSQLGRVHDLWVSRAVFQSINHIGGALYGPSYMVSKLSSDSCASYCLSHARSYSSSNESDGKPRRNAKASGPSGPTKGKVRDTVFDEFYNVHFQDTCPKRGSSRQQNDASFNSQEKGAKKNQNSRQQNNTNTATNNNQPRNNNGGTNSPKKNKASDGSSARAKVSRSRPKWEYYSDEELYEYLVCSDEEEKAFLKATRRQARAQRRVERTGSGRRTAGINDDEDIWDEEKVGESFRRLNEAEMRRRQGEAKAGDSKRAGGGKERGSTFSDFYSNTEEEFDRGFQGRGSGKAPGGKAGFERDFGDWFASHKKAAQEAQESRRAGSSSSDSFGGGASSSGSWRDEADRTQKRNISKLEELLRSIRFGGSGFGSGFRPDSNFNFQEFNEKFYKGYSHSYQDSSSSSSSSSWSSYSQSSSSMAAVPPQVVEHLSVLGLSAHGGTAPSAAAGGVSSSRVGEAAPPWSRMDEVFLKKAFRARAMEWHPDRHTCPTSKERAEEKFKQVQGAYQALLQHLQQRGGARATA